LINVLLYIYNIQTYRTGAFNCSDKKIGDENALYIFLIAFCFFSFGCSNANLDAVDLEFDFSWPGQG